MKLRPFDRPLLVIDVETTGTDPTIHQVISIGALLLDATTLKEERTFHSLVHATTKTLSSASSKAMAIHGLTGEQLKKAPKAKDVIQQFVDTFGYDFYFCGWNICFDTQFMAALFRQANRQEDFDRFRYHKLDVWTLLEYAWLSGRLENPPDSLSAVCREFNIQRANVHDALEDARITVQVLRKTLRLLEEGAR